MASLFAVRQQIKNGIFLMQKEITYSKQKQKQKNHQQQEETGTVCFCLSFFLFFWP